MNKRIEIVGILGAGKTTLLQNMDIVMNIDIKHIYEELSPINDIWDLVKNDKKQNHYFLLLSAYYLESTCKIIHEITNNNNKIFITDYSLSVHHYVYAYYCLKNKLINGIEWNTLSKMLDFYSNIIPPLVGIIEIDTLPSKALDNLRIRNRNLDKNTSIDYLERLYEYMQINRSNINNGLPSIKLKSEEIVIFDDITKRRINNLISYIQ
jgi:deoxyadenosine/deoxycytidine kinase